MKNAYIELFRFIGALVIMGHHSIFLSADLSRTCFWGGWIFVEFFFMLSGYWTTAHFAGADRSDMRESFFYMYSKVKRILPFALVGIVISYICANLRGMTGWYESTKMFLDLLISCVFLGPNLASNSYAGQLWYVSQLIFVLPIIAFLISACKSVYKYYICWSVPVFLYTYAIDAHGSISTFCNATCAIRGVSGIMLGSVLYYILQHFRQKCASGWGGGAKARTLCVALKWSCLIFLLVSQFFAPFSDASAGYIFIVFIMLFVTLYTEDHGLKKGAMYDLFLHLGKLSLPVFCLHSSLMEVVQLMMPQHSMPFKSGASVLLVIIISEFLLLIVNKFLTEKKLYADQGTG